MSFGPPGGMFGLGQKGGKSKKLSRSASNLSMGSPMSTASSPRRRAAKRSVPIYERDADWLHRREARALKAKREAADREMAECTFSPATNRVQPPSGRRIVSQVKMKIRAAAYTAGGVDFARLFNQYDKDHSGALDFEEFRSALRRDAKIPRSDVTDTELKQVFGTVDIDGGGEVDIDEFVKWINSEDPEDDILAFDQADASPSKRKRRKRRPEGSDDEQDQDSDADGISGWSDKATPPIKAARARKPIHTVPEETVAALLARPQMPDTPLIKRVKIKLRAAAYTSRGRDYAKLFKHYDRDNSGSLEFPEFCSALRRDAKITRTEVTDEELKEVFDTVDVDGGGEVDIDEFIVWVNADTSAARPKKKKKKRKKRSPSKRRQRKTFELKPLDEGSDGGEDDGYVETELEHKVKTKLRAAAYTSGGVDYAKLFKHYDRDNSGSLDFDELRSALRRDAKVKVSDVTDMELRSVFDTVDEDGGGEVDIDEFVAWLNRKGKARKSKAKTRPGVYRQVKRKRKVKRSKPAAAAGGGSDASPARASATATPAQPTPGSSGQQGTPGSGSGRKRSRGRGRSKKDSKLIKQVKMKLRAAAYTSKGMDFARLFKHYDRDNSGSLDFDEFRSALRRDAKITANQVSDRELKHVFASVDEDGGGEVEIDEFVEWLGLNKTPKKSQRPKEEVVDSPIANPEMVAETARLEEERRRLWNDVLDLPDDLLAGVGASEALNQQLHKVRTHIGRAAAPPPPITTAESAPVAATPEQAEQDLQAALLASPPPRPVLDGPPAPAPATSYHEAAAPASAAATSVAANESTVSQSSHGEHAKAQFGLLESTYEAYFGQEGAVANVLKAAGDVLPLAAGAVARSSPSASPPATTASPIPAAESPLPEPAAGMSPIPVEPSMMSPAPQQATPAAHPPLIGTPMSGGPTPDAARHMNLLRSELSKQRQEHKAEIEALKAKHQAALDVAKAMPSAAQAAKFEDLMARFEATETEKAGLLVSSAACQRQLQHMQAQNEILARQVERMKTRVSQQTGRQVIRSTPEEIAAAHGEAVEAAVARQMEDTQGELQHLIATTSVLEAKLASADAELKQLRNQRAKLTAEREKWLEQLGGEHEQLRDILTGAKRAKEHLVEEMNLLAQAREDFDSERLELLQDVIRAQQSGLRPQIADGDTSPRDDGSALPARGNGESSPAHHGHAAPPAPEAAAPPSPPQPELVPHPPPFQPPPTDGQPIPPPMPPPGSKQVDVDGVIVHVLEADAMPGPLSEQGAIELLARHKVNALREQRAADAARKLAEEEKVRADKAALEAQRAYASIEDIKSEYELRISDVEDKLFDKIQELEHKNRVLQRSIAAAGSR